jgi:hypothetical protein
MTSSDILPIGILLVVKKILPYLTVPTLMESLLFQLFDHRAEDKGSIIASHLVLDHKRMCLQSDLQMWMLLPAWGLDVITSSCSQLCCSLSPMRRAVTGFKAGFH